MSWVDDAIARSKANMQKFGSQLNDWLNWVNLPTLEGGLGGTQGIKALWGDNASQGLMSTLLSKTGALDYLNPYYIKTLTQSAPVMQMFGDLSQIGQGAAPDMSNLPKYMVDWITSGGPSTGSVNNLWKQFFNTAESVAGSQTANTPLGTYLKSMSPSTLEDIHDAVLSYLYAPGVAQAISNRLSPEYAMLPAIAGQDTLSGWTDILRQFGLVPVAPATPTTMGYTSPTTVWNAYYNRPQ